jgi:hypothetical protein
MVLIYTVGYAFPAKVKDRLSWYYKTVILKLFYKQMKGDRIDLPKAPAGVIAVRKWGINRKGLLTSLNQSKLWKGLVYEDKEPPEVRSNMGLYAFRLGSNHSKNYTGFVIPKVMGIVSLSGTVIGHQDGILRGKKATILCLVTGKYSDAVKLRTNYGCPVFVNTNPSLAIETWAMTEQGLFWQAHNNKLIKEKRYEKVADAIESLDAYKGFGEV